MENLNRILGILGSDMDQESIEIALEQEEDFLFEEEHKQNKNKKFKKI